MISGQSLTCPKGASLTFEIDMDTGSDLTGATAQWALCESWFDQAKVYLTKTGAGDGLFIGQDAGVWKITVNLAPTDTLDIPSGLLYHDCKVLLQSGDVEDVANGPFSLDPSVNIFLTNASITRNLHAVQLLGRLGQNAPLTVAWLARNLLATQSLVGLGQSVAGTVTSGGISPAFSAGLTALTSLPSWLSLYRASNAMVTDSIGNLTYAPNNLVEDGSYSVSYIGGGTRTATGLSDPDGGSNALQVTFIAANQEFYNTYIVLGGARTLSSIWVKGTSGETISLDGDDVSSTLFTLTGAWQQIYVFGTYSNGNRYADIGTKLGATARVVQIYKPVIAQVTYETAPRTQDQVLNNGPAYYGPRFDHAWNGSAWVATGLLIEEQRTNAVLQSTDLSNGLWGSPGPASSIAHTGATNKAGSASWRLTSDTASQVHGWQQQVTLAAGVATVALDVKYVDNQWFALGFYDGGYQTASFDILNGVKGVTASGVTSTMKSLGGGWYRITASRTLAGANPYIAFFVNGSDTTNNFWTPSVAVSADVDFPQLEAGAFATSYIPTTTAAVTRSADIVQLTGAAATQLNTAPFSLIAEAQVSSAPANWNILVSDSGANQWLGVLGTSISTITTYNGAQDSANLSSGNVYSPFRAAVAGDTSTSSLVANGGTVTTDALHGIKTTGMPYLGSDGSGNYALNGWLRSIAIYSSRLSDTDLQAKSVVGAAF